MFASTIHKHMNQCPQLIAQGCPIEGCSYVPENKCGEKLKLHMQEYAVYHAFLQNKAHKEMQSQIISIVADGRREVAEKDEQLAAKDELLKMKNEEMEELKEELKSAKEEIQQMYLLD